MKIFGGKGGKRFYWGNWGEDRGGGGVGRGRERSWGEKALGGKGGKEVGKDLNRQRGENILGRKRKKILGGKGLRGERGGRDLIPEGNWLIWSLHLFRRESNMPIWRIGGWIVFGGLC